jgi:hypothetical protein
MMNYKETLNLKKVTKIYSLIASTKEPLIRAYKERQPSHVS